MEPTSSCLHVTHRFVADDVLKLLRVLFGECFGDVLDAAGGADGDGRPSTSRQGSQLELRSFAWS